MKTTYEALKTMTEDEFVGVLSKPQALTRGLIDKNG